MFWNILKLVFRCAIFLTDSHTFNFYILQFMFLFRHIHIETIQKPDTWNPDSFEIWTIFGLVYKWFVPEPPKNGVLMAVDGLTIQKPA